MLQPTWQYYLKNRRTSGQLIHGGQMPHGSVKPKLQTQSQLAVARALVSNWNKVQEKAPATYLVTRVLQLHRASQYCQQH